MMTNIDTGAAPTKLEHARVKSGFENIKDGEEDNTVPYEE